MEGGEKGKGKGGVREWRGKSGEGRGERGEERGERGEGRGGREGRGGTVKVKDIHYASH